MYTIGDARHAFLKIEVEMCHGGVEVLAGEYLGARIDQGKVIMELLNYSPKFNNSDTILTPEIRSFGVQTRNYGV